MARVNEVYQAMTQIAHSPKTVPWTKCEVTDRDLALCEWQDSTATATNGPRDLHETPQGFVLKVAYGTKQMGRHVDAIAFVYEALRKLGFDRQLIWYLSKLFVQWILYQISNRVRS